MCFPIQTHTYIYLIPKYNFLLSQKIFLFSKLKKFHASLKKFRQFLGSNLKKKKKNLMQQIYKLN